MNYKPLLFILLLSALIISGTLFAGSRSETYNSSSQNTPTQPLTTNAQKVTLSELNKHTQLTDCWVAYKSKVYDITNWLPKHPGTAQVILPYCGTAQEFEQAFTQKHGTKKASLLMKVGVFIGDFQDRGNLQESNNNQDNNIIIQDSNTIENKNNIPLKEKLTNDN